MTMGRVCGYAPHKKRGKGFKMFPYGWSTYTPPNVLPMRNKGLYKALFREANGQGSLHYPIKQFKCMVVLRDFLPLNSAWLGLVIQ